ncbi:alpha/beta hydrolase [Paenibacillus radicis (ex Gao et al. 2016)]|uniref:Esterase n=1 Tax=Paenibacillus radicis (ex Gao et al. 2016) TaxID=1737354 RepID=A0A917GYY7_9BACL|nr:alpha/beta hydrolase family protein [Paenibacillus radicis (ex Gao et al. 2016)]GGG62123.1 esterase [Paenibacillus radicis (ex Gao et al. 2016)]
MALVQCDYFSETLGMNTSMTVILPQKTVSQIGMEGAGGADKHPVLYLLHGLSDDHTIWLRRTSIERYVASLGLAVVMPNLHKSFYTEMEQGDRYWTFLTEELPVVARSFFPLSAEREQNFVAGLSMGGYGAFKWALNYPERFAAAGSLSGALDMHGHREKLKPGEGLYVPIRKAFGERPIKGTIDDLLWMAEQADKQTGPKPLLYQCCGTEDFLYQDNLNFREACLRTDLQLTYSEEPGATHDWNYWDKKIQDVVNWLPLK